MNTDKDKQLEAHHNDFFRLFALLYIYTLCYPAYALLYIKAKQYFNKSCFRGPNKYKWHNF